MYSWRIPPCDCNILPLIRLKFTSMTVPRFSALIGLIIILYLVLFVDIWRHLLEDPGQLFSGVVVDDAEHAGWDGHVELGHTQHLLRHVEHLSARNMADNMATYGGP